MPLDYEQMEVKCRALGVRPYFATYQPLTDEDVRDFEHRLKTKIPSDLVRLLANFGGGFFDNAVRVKTANAESAMQEFGLLLGSAGIDDKWNLSVRHLRENYKRFLPTDVLPFATSSKYDAFCFVLKGPVRGYVFLWDIREAACQIEEREAPPGETLDEDFMSFVAPSLGDFFEQLEVFEPSWSKPTITLKKVRALPNASEDD